MSSDRRRRLSATCLALLGLAFLSEPITHVASSFPASTPLAIALRGFSSLLLMALFVGSVVGITQLLRLRADVAGLIGAAMAVMGWTAGMRIGVLNQLNSLLTKGAANLPPDTLHKILDAAPIVWVSIVAVGLFFPIGLITLGVSMLVVRPIPWWISVVFIAGAVLFPIGRALRYDWAILACDLILGAAFALIGWQLITRPELWPRSAQSTT